LFFDTLLQKPEEEKGILLIDACLTARLPGGGSTAFCWREEIKNFSLRGMREKKYS
jgi:hypothetical protein